MTFTYTEEVRTIIFSKNEVPYEMGKESQSHKTPGTSKFAEED
jgi:hypothetical protein